MDLITGLRRIMAAIRDRSAYRFMIGLIIGAPVIGRAMFIMYGSPATGGGGTARKFGSAVTTSCDDTRTASRQRPSAALGDLGSAFLECFKRSVEPSPSAPNENARLSRGSLVRSARFFGN